MACVYSPPMVSVQHRCPVLITFVEVMTADVDFVIISGTYKRRGVIWLSNPSRGVIRTTTDDCEYQLHNTNTYSGLKEVHRSLNFN